MNIKKLTLFIIVIAFSLCLSSCSSFRSELFARNDHKIAETRLQKIINALEKKDKVGLKKMFSPNALKDAKDIDGGIDYVMNFYKGNIKSSKFDALTAPSSYEDGEEKSELDCGYIVTTDKDTYTFYFVDKIVDTKNSDNVGLYRLEIVKEPDSGKEPEGDINSPGIVHPDTVK